MSDGIDEQIGGVRVRVVADSGEVSVTGGDHLLTEAETIELARLLAAAAAVAAPGCGARRRGGDASPPRAGDVIRSDARSWWVDQEQIDRAARVRREELAALDGLTPEQVADLTLEQLLLWSWSGQADAVAEVARGLALELGVRLGALGLASDGEG